MKKILLNSILLLSFVNSASATVIAGFNGDGHLNQEGPSSFMMGTCLSFVGFSFADPREERDPKHNGCLALLTTTSLPTLLIENPKVTIESPETMSALINGDVDMANLVGLHFDISGDKILETVAIMDEAGVEVTLENIGNNL